MANLRHASGHATLIGMYCNCFTEDVTHIERIIIPAGFLFSPPILFHVSIVGYQRKMSERDHTPLVNYKIATCQPQGDLFSWTPCSPHTLGWYLYQAFLHSINLQHLNLLFCTLLAEGCKCFMSRWACSITILLEGWISFLHSWVSSEVVLSLKNVNFMLVTKWKLVGCCK